MKNRTILILDWEATFSKELQTLQDSIQKNDMTVYVAQTFENALEHISDAAFVELHPIDCVIAKESVDIEDIRSLLGLILPNLTILKPSDMILILEGDPDRDLEGNFSFDTYCFPDLGKSLEVLKETAQ